MLGSLAAAAASHRILTSRVFVAAFLIVLLLTEGTAEGSLLSAALFLVGVILIGVATAGRLWCCLYIGGYKGAELITTGPYSMCRNPLYFFSFLGFVGIGLATETMTLALVIGIVFLLGYRVVIEREETELSTRFGARYKAYLARTPRFFPDLSKFEEPGMHLVNPAAFRRSMADVVWFIWMVGITEFVDILHNVQIIKPLLKLP